MRNKVPLSAFLLLAPSLWAGFAFAGSNCVQAPQTATKCQLDWDKTRSLWGAMPKSSSVDLASCFPPLRCQDGGTCFAEASTALLSAAIARRDQTPPLALSATEAVVAGISGESQESFNARIGRTKKNLELEDRITASISAGLSLPRSLENRVSVRFTDGAPTLNTLDGLIQKGYLHTEQSFPATTAQINQHTEKMVRENKTSQEIRDFLVGLHQTQGSVSTKGLRTFQQSFQKLDDRDLAFGVPGIFQTLAHESQQEVRSTLLGKCAYDSKKIVEAVLTKLCSGIPVGATLNPSLIRSQNGQTTPSGSRAPLHAVVIQGVRPGPDGSPEFVLRNSWGSVDTLSAHHACSIADIYGIELQNTDLFLTESPHRAREAADPKHSSAPIPIDSETR